MESRVPLGLRGTLPLSRREGKQSGSDASSLFGQKVVCRACVSLQSCETLPRDAMNASITHRVHDVNLYASFVEVLSKSCWYHFDALPGSKQENFCIIRVCTMKQETGEESAVTYPALVRLSQISRSAPVSSRPTSSPVRSTERPCRPKRCKPTVE